MKAPTRPDPPAQTCNRLMALGVPVGLSGLALHTLRPETGGIVTTGFVIFLVGAALIIIGWTVLFKAKD